MSTADTAVLTFVTSLRHYDTTRDYGQVEALLRSTLRSLDAQTDRRCRAVVVANADFHVPRDINLPVDVIQVDFPPPPGLNGSKEELHAALRLDKGSKLAVAVSRVTGGHVMFVDADDFVSRRIVDFVAAHPDRRGWYVERGFTYDVVHGLYRPLNRFNTVCGTSLVFARSLMPMIDVPAGASRDEVLRLYGTDCVLYELGSHRHLHERYRLDPLPFRGAMYCVNNGQNSSRKSLINLGRPLPSVYATEFGIDRRPPVAMWRAAAAGVAPGIARLASATSTGGVRRLQDVIAD